MRHLVFKKGTLPFLILFCLLIFLSGCVFLVVGGVGALGGYIVSPDTIEGVTDHDQAQAWDAAISIISIMGTILEKSEQGGLIISKVSGTKVIVNVIPISGSTVKVSVKARKAFLPRIKVAQDVYVKIMTRLAE